MKWRFPLADQLQLFFQKAGLYTSVQDSGRPGVQDLGIPIGGALDLESMQMANELVGNAKNNAVLEVTMMGPEIMFEGHGQLAITGADMEPTINGKPIPMYQTIDIETGDLLKLGTVKHGCRSYISIGGKWLSPTWLKSQSAPAKLMSSESFPSKIEQGDSLTIEVDEPIEKQTRPLSQRPLYASCYIVRVVTGPEFELFDISDVQDFFDQIFVIDAASNRMGCRLKGTIKNYVSDRDEISSGIVPGTVQITNSGSPVILMADAQTTGGYPRIVNIVSEDLDIVAQMKPGDELKFMLVSLEDL